MTESATFTGQVDQRAKRARERRIVEGRVATDPDSRGRVLVSSRALTGTSRPLGPFACRAWHRHDGETVVYVARGDRVWLGLDESGSPACIVGWDG